MWQDVGYLPLNSRSNVLQVVFSLVSGKRRLERLREERVTDIYSPSATHSLLLVYCFKHSDTLRAGKMCKQVGITLCSLLSRLSSIAVSRHVLCDIAPLPMGITVMCKVGGSEQIVLRLKHMPTGMTTHLLI